MRLSILVEREPSFIEKAIAEAVAISRKKQCCRRAFLLGALLSSKVESSRITLKAKGKELCEYLQKLIKEQFGRETQEKKNTGSYSISFDSAAAMTMLSDTSEAYGQIVKCQGCIGSFLCGLMCTSVSINDSKSDYYLSIRVPFERKETVFSALTAADLSASYREVGNKSVYYMRASGRIEDFLAVCGMQRLLFEFINSKIEKDFRNNANRISNAEYNNIQKSVGAAQKYIEAIEWLRENDRLTGLDTELSEAARLRVENPDCSLSALGAMMQPSVSKSGVVHRLNRIYDIYLKAKGSSSK